MKKRERDLLFNSEDITSKNLRFKFFATTSRAADVGMLLQFHQKINIIRYKETLNISMNIAACQAGIIKLAFRSQFQEVLLLLFQQINCIADYIRVNKHGITELNENK
jgi:hypothetical protein